MGAHTGVFPLLNAVLGRIRRVLQGRAGLHGGRGVVYDSGAGGDSLPLPVDSLCLWSPLSITRSIPRNPNL